MAALDLAHTLLPQGPFLWPFLFGAGIYGIRYLLLAGIAFLAWYGKRAVQPRNRKLQDAAPRAGQIRREIAYSVMAVLIFGVINGVIFGYGIAPHTQLYWNAAQYGWVYFWLSIPLMIVVHDAYFYWTHRLMHTRALFRTFHGVHHLSTNPTPWTSYAFHPFESVVEALGVVLIFFIMPSPVGSADFPDRLDPHQRIRPSRLRALSPRVAAAPAGPLDQHLGRTQRPPRQGAPQLRLLLPVLGPLDGDARSILRGEIPREIRGVAAGS